MDVNLTDNTQYKNQIKALWSYAFSETDTFVNAYFDSIWNGKNAVTVIQNQRVVGALELVPYQIALRNTPTACSYIVGVSIAPEARGRGLSATLMRGALKKQQERKETISLLIPFSYSFYEKMGYTACYQEIHCHVPAAAFPKLYMKAGFFPASVDDIKDLCHVYNIFCRDKNGYTVRKEAEWKYIFNMLPLTNGYIYGFRNQAGTVSAYLSYIKNDKEFCVTEAAYTDTEGLNALIAFIASHFSTNSHIHFTLPTNSPIPFMFTEPPACKYSPTAMARILNIPAALSAGLNGLRLHVTDAFLPNNTGVYEGNEGKVIKTNQKSYDAKIDIGSLTQLIMGYASAQELAIIGRLTANQDAICILDKLYPKEYNYINHILRD
ncbi:MAG: GNAT family N-acetyltransferase [Ruminococcaceae bacterium]|nr:GNAT family N-acetyltransferase [Oscillospiraceae bacterium]